MPLQAFYGIRWARQLMERIEFDLLFRWFVGLGIDEAVWDHSSFTANRERLLSGEITATFLRAVPVPEQSPHCGAPFAFRGQTRDMSAPGSGRGPPD